MDYTAVGETTHLAARMEQMAAPGSILIGPRTVSLAEGYVNVRRLGPFRVKGLAETIEVHQLLGPGTLRSRVHQAAARGFASFVGREHEGHDADLGDHDGPIRVITMLRRVIVDTTCESIRSHSEPCQRDAVNYQ